MSSRNTPNIVEHAGSGLRMPEHLARRIEDLSDRLPSDLRYTRLCSKSVKTEALMDGSRSDISTITTDDPDRESDVILPDGMDTSEFMKNPQVLYCHDYSQLPVGKCLWIQRQSNGLVAKSQYAKRPAGWQGDWLPDAILSLMQEGLCRGKSVGFFPLSKRSATSDELRRRPDWKGCPIISRSLLLEFSVVTIPCNPYAMAQTVSKCVSDLAVRKTIIDGAKATMDLEQLIVRRLTEALAPVAEAFEVGQMVAAVIRDQSAEFKAWYRQGTRTR